MPFHRSNTVRLVVILAAVLTIQAAALAQRGGRDDNDDDDRRYNPAEMLPRFDDDGDGVIQPAEVSSRGRRYYERMLDGTGLDPDQPVVISRAVAIIERKQQLDQRREDRQQWVATLRNTSGEAAVPGFGEPQDLPAVPGFGPPAGEQLPLESLYTERLLKEVGEIFERYDRDDDGQLDSGEQSRVRWSSDPKQSDLNGDGILDRREMAERLAKRWGDSARIKPEDRPEGVGGCASSNGGSGGSDSSSKIRSYANSLLKQYDGNKNGVLEKEEWKNMSGNPERADANNDGVITLDELTNRLANYSRGERDEDDDDRRRGSRGSRSRDSGGGYYRSRRDDDGSGDSAESYRFLSPTERLPSGTPSWFLRADANADGQVEMHEYSATWNDTKAAEFEELDRDGDGRITAGEAIAAE